MNHHQGRAIAIFRENLSLFQKLFTAMALEILLFDGEGRILDRCPGPGHPTGSALPSRLSDRFTAEIAGQLTGALRDMASAGAPSDFRQVEAESIAGEAPILLRFTLTLFSVPDPPFPLAVAAVEDITRQKQMEMNLQALEQQVRTITTQIFDRMESERKLLAANLHDSIGGALAAIRYSLEKKNLQAEKGDTISFTDVVTMLQNTVEEVRRISTNLRPPILDDLGILTTINWFCREFLKVYSDIRIEKFLHVQEHEVPDELKIVIYRILQEAMNNIARHSRADRVRILLEKKGPALHLMIADNGIGFNRTGKNEGRVGLGLNGMKDRAALLGGTCRIRSEPGQGTTIEIAWPVAETPAEIY